MYEINISGQHNTKTPIRKGHHTSNLAIADTPNLLNANRYVEFWADAQIVDSKAVVRLGKGFDIGSNVIVEYTDSNPLDVTSVGLMSWD